MVPQHGRGIGSVAGPVAAGPVAERAGIGGAVQPRSGQDVVFVRAVAAPFDRLPPLVDRGQPGQIVVAGMQIVHILRYHHAVCVIPWAGTDTVTRIDEIRIVQGRGLGAEIGAPGAVARARFGGQRLTMAVGPFKPAQISALSGAAAGQEEAHARIRRLARLHIGLHAGDSGGGGREDAHGQGDSCLFV